MSALDTITGSFLGGGGGGGGTDWGSLLGSVGSIAGDIYGDVKGAQGSNQIGNLLTQGASFNQYRPQYAQQLSNLMKDPSSITSTPGYQFGMDQAEGAVQHGLGSQGLIGGGTMAQTMANTGAQYAGQQLNQQENLLAGLSGAQFNPAEFEQPMTNNTQSQASSGGSFLKTAGSIAGIAAAFGF